MSRDEYLAFFERARGKIRFRDFLWLLPPGVAVIIGMHIRQKLSGRIDERPRFDDLSARDPELLELAVEMFRLIGRDYFRLQVRGVANVPASGPLLLVGNHNGCALPLDGMFTLVALHDHFGPQRIVHPLAHEVVFTHPTLRRYACGIGVLQAGRGASDKALAAGRAVLVYPGSDWDACRSFADRGRVDLHGRTGFLQVALKNRAPITPVVSAGTHEQLIVLTRGDAIARALRLHKLLRTDVFPLVLALPWGLSHGYLPYLPLPAQTTLSFGAPIVFREVEPAQAADPEVLARCYEVVRGRMQALLDELMAGRRLLRGQ